MSAALILNASYEPLCVVPLRRAVVLVLAEKAEVVAHRGVMRSATREFPLPAVVRLTRYVHVPYRRSRAVTRRTVLARDGHRCQYCGGHADTVDHVVPRSRGGEHVWTNVVAACRSCNGTKGDRTLAELGWKLARPAAEPPATVAVVLGVARIDPAWEPFLFAA